MEQREVKTEPTHRKRSKRQSSSTSNSSTLCFPLDLILEILLRLPAKSIVRFRCVSKLWSSITTDLYFTNLYQTRSSLWPSLLMFFKKGANLFVYSFPQHYQNSNDQSHSYSYRMKYPKRCCFPITESVHGLICFRVDSKPIIWNPTMRQFTPIRKPDKSWKGIAVFLGYDPIQGKHKLVCMPRDNTYDECRILTLGSSGQESWRKIKTNHKHQPTYRYYGQCINGVVYYQAYIDRNGKKNPALMSFDVKTEKFDMIELPCSSFVKMLIPYHGKLACVNNNYNMIKGVVNGITLWTLEDGEKHKWSCKHFLAPFTHYDRNLETDFKLAGITHAGEFIYVPSTILNSFYILYFDPKKNNFRKVEFRGVADELFRLGNELRDKRLNRLHTFPRHIQSLLS